MERYIFGLVPLMSAESSIILGYNDPELGIDKKMNTSAKFVSDEDSSWYQVHFDGLYCIDQVMSLDADIYTHCWNCKESGCGTPCEGVMCKYVDVTVINKNVVSQNNVEVLDETNREKCGDAVKISISKKNAKKLGYDFFEITELAVVGHHIGWCSNQAFSFLVYPNNVGHPS